MEKYSRREAIKKIARTTTGLAAILSVPTIVSAAPKPYPYKTPTSREDLRNIPTNHLLGRLIYGEARGSSPEEKIAIGYTTLNRKEAEKSYYGLGSMKAIMLHKHNGRHQYDCFNDTSGYKKILENFLKTLDPARDNPKEWKECLNIANFIMEHQKFKDLNQGQTSYVTSAVAEELRNQKESNWFKRSIEIGFPYNFEHEFVMDPSLDPKSELPLCLS